MNDPDLTKFRAAIAERRARLAAEEALKQEHDADLVPSTPYERSEADFEMDRVLDSIDILDAYRRWCGKMTPVVRGGQREGIMISCPVPTHADTNPSAWINLDKQVWSCGACQTGGDKFDIAAFHYNYPVPEYKEGKAFHDLREKMAEDYGFRIQVLAGGVRTLVPPEKEDERPDDSEPVAKVDPPPVAKSGDTTPTPSLAVVSPISTEEDEEDEGILPSLDWRSIIPHQTFLDEYMQATTVDDVPEEFHFFNATLALGFAIGRDVTLIDSLPVKGNLFICSLGKTGSGKSKAKHYLDDVLGKALPYQHSDPINKGTRNVSSPASAEVLIEKFMRPVEDPSNPKKVAYYAPVRGLIQFNELSALLSKSSRLGSVMIPTLLEFYDCYSTVSTSSVTHGTKEAHDSFASALTSTQIKSLRVLLDKTDEASGFLNRWLFVPGTYKPKWALMSASVDMDPAVRPLEEIFGWAGSFRPDELMRWSEKSFHLFTEFFKDQIEPDQHRARHEMIARIDLLMKKIILLLSSNLMEKEVPEQAVLDAIKMYGYLKDSLGLIAGEIGNTLSSEISNKIQKLVRDKKRFPRGPTNSEISKALKGSRYDDHDIIRAIDGLVKLGLMESFRTTGVGRHTERFRWVD